MKSVHHISTTQQGGIKSDILQSKNSNCLASAACWSCWKM